jgi:hypothetical protein
MAEGKAILKSKSAVAGYIALVLGNSKFWDVVGRAGDVDFLLQTVSKMWPAAVATGLFLREWGWIFGLAWLAFLWFRPERPPRIVVPDAQTQSVSREPGPGKFSVVIFRHAAAATDGRHLQAELIRFFRDVGWEVEEGYTELSQHAEGVFVKGPNTPAHTILKWALREVGIDARIDAAQDHSGGWQVIIGAGDHKIRRLALLCQVP